MAENKNRIIRILAVLMVAAAAGFVMQNMQKAKQPPTLARTEVGEEPKAIENLAAGAETAPVVAKPPEVKSAQVLPVVEPVAPQPVAPQPAPIVMAAAEATLPAAPPMPAAKPMLPTTTTTTPEPAPLAATDACAITLDLIPEANATIGLTLSLIHLQLCIRDRPRANPHNPHPPPPPAAPQTRPDHQTREMRERLGAEVHRPRSPPRSPDGRRDGPRGEVVSEGVRGSVSQIGIFGTRRRGKAEFPACFYLS